jgi:hypothetical protein
VIHRHQGRHDRRHSAAVHWSDDCRADSWLLYIQYHHHHHHDARFSILEYRWWWDCIHCVDRWRRVLRPHSRTSSVSSIFSLSPCHVPWWFVFFVKNNYVNFSILWETFCVLWLKIPPPGMVAENQKKKKNSIYEIIWIGFIFRFWNHRPKQSQVRLCVVTLTDCTSYLLLS